MPVTQTERLQLRLAGFKAITGRAEISGGRPNWRGNFAPPTKTGQTVRAPMEPPTVAQVDLYVQLGGPMDPNILYRAEISTEIGKMIEGGATTAERQAQASRSVARAESARLASKRRRERQREWKKHYLPKGW
jgi:hypothetical protein